MTPFISRRALLLSIPASFAVAIGARAGLFSSSVPDDLDLSLVRMSEKRLYRASLVPDALPITVRQMHSWTLALESAGGAAVSTARFAISGGMPQHGHGLPTAPQVTQNLGQGRYLIEGVKFNMRGWWTFEIKVDGRGGRDVVIFNLML
jgi:hypothetical protein